MLISPTKFISFFAYTLLWGPFVFSCKKDDTTNPSTQTQVKTNMSSGSWRITRFVDSGTDELHHFNGYSFTFQNGVVSATNGTNTYTGSWSITDSNSSDDGTNSLDFNLNFNLTNDFEDLNDDWDFVSQSATKVELVDVSGGGGGTDYLTFERN